MSPQISVIHKDCVCVCVWLSPVRLFVTPWAVAHQASQSMEFLGKNTAVVCHALLQGIYPGGEPRDQTHVSIACRLFTVWAIREAFFYFVKINISFSFSYCVSTVGCLNLWVSASWFLVCWFVSVFILQCHWTYGRRNRDMRTAGA